MNSLIEIIKFHFIEGGRYKYLLDGLKTSLIVALLASLIGLVLGVTIALIRSSYKDLRPRPKSFAGLIHMILNKLAGLYVTIIRGTPTTLQLLAMYNIFLNTDNLRLTATLTFGLNSAAYISEIFRGGIQNVSQGEKEAARSLGLSYRQTAAYVVLPQAFKNSLQALGNELITLFKETSVSGFIGLIDITRASTIILSQTFDAIPAYLASALIYLAIVLILEKIFKHLEVKLSHDGH